MWKKLNLVDVFSKGSIFLTKIRLSGHTKDTANDWQHTQFLYQALLNSRKGTNSCSPLATRTQDDQTWVRTEKDFLLTQNRYCMSLHKRGLGLKQLIYSCCGRYTALSHYVCIYVADQYLCKKIVLLDFFRLGSIGFESYLLGNRGQINLLKLFCSSNA